MWKKIQDYFRQKNYEGVFVPFISDPKSKWASASLTLMVIAFGWVSASLFTAKINNANAFSLFLATAGLYIGRKVVGKNEVIDSPDLTQKEEPKQP